MSVVAGFQKSSVAQGNNVSIQLPNFSHYAGAAQVAASTTLHSLVGTAISAGHGLTSDQMMEMSQLKWRDGSSILSNEFRPFGTDTSEVEARQELTYELLAMINAPYAEGKRLGVEGVATTLKNYEDKNSLRVTTAPFFYTGAIFSAPHFRREEQFYLAEIDRSENKVVISNSNKPCERCGEMSVVFVPVQKRSADEPATIEYTCHNPLCGYKWAHRG